MPWPTTHPVSGKTSPVAMALRNSPNDVLRGRASLTTCSRKHILHLWASLPVKGTDDRNNLRSCP